MIKLKNLVVSFDNLWNACNIFVVNKDTEFVPTHTQLAEVGNEGSDNTLHIRFSVGDFIECLSDSDKESLLEMLYIDIGYEESLKIIEDSEAEYTRKAKEETNKGLTVSHFFRDTFNHDDYDRYGNRIDNDLNEE